MYVCMYVYSTDIKIEGTFVTTTCIQNNRVHKILSDCYIFAFHLTYNNSQHIMHEMDRQDT